MGRVADFTRGAIDFLAPGAAVVGAAALLSTQGGARVGGAVWLSAAAAAIVASSTIDRTAKRRAEAVARHFLELERRGEGPPAPPAPPAA